MTIQPIVYESAFSGCRFGLPPSRPLYWLAEFGSDVAELGRCHTGELALRERHAVGQRGRGCLGRGARINRTVQAHRLRGEQLADVRRTHGALVAAAEANVAYRRPLRPDLVGVGVKALAVLGVAVAGIQRKILGARRWCWASGRRISVNTSFTVKPPVTGGVGPPLPAAEPCWLR